MPTHVVSTICDDRGEEPTYAGVTMTSLMTGDFCVGDVISLLWFKRQLPQYATRFIEMCVMLCADHGPCVSGAPPPDILSHDAASPTLGHNRFMPWPLRLPADLMLMFTGGDHKMSCAHVLAPPSGFPGCGGGTNSFRNKHDMFVPETRTLCDAHAVMNLRQCAARAAN